MVKRNPHFAKLTSGYLFPEINKRKLEFLKKNPTADLISLGIGDTTEPISSHIVKGLILACTNLGEKSTYTGYGPERGKESLRKKIATMHYNNLVDPEEIFISDGSKCDIGRLQLLFGSNCTMAVQDPSYPAYVDTGVIIGQTGAHNGTHYQGIVYMPCLPQNNFFPDLSHLPSIDILYFCSPNNPTGVAATKEELQKLIDFALANKVLIIFDAAYSSFISDPEIPKSIYEIPGASKVAIELNSLSKMAGFTGIRLGFNVIPKELHYSDGGSIHQDWVRISTTFFNGASNIAQVGGEYAFDLKGQVEIKKQIDTYLTNALLIKNAFQEMGLPVFGGVNAPYVWVQFPGRLSWDVFNELLEKAHVVTTPGSGFGPAGESFIRFSAFGNPERIFQAIDRLKIHFSTINCLPCH